MSIGQVRMRTEIHFRKAVAILAAGIMIVALFPPVFCLGQDVAIGAVEDVLILPWNIRLTARIDTGAATTSLDARNLKMMGDLVEFRLPDPHGNQLIRLPLKSMRNVRSSSGQQQRPVVELTICLGGKKMAVDVNLANRSHMAYPLLVGRNVLEQGFLVDVRQSGILPPNCSDKKAP